MKYIFSIFIFLNTAVISIYSLHSYKVCLNQTPQTQSKTYICFCGMKADANLPISGAKNGVSLGCLKDTESPLVLSFNMSVVNGTSIKTTSSNSNNLTSEQKDLMSKIKSGSKIVFDKVKIKMSDGKTSIIGPGTFTVQ